METLEIIVTILEVIASIALIVVVLLQSGKEAGLSGALSGSSDSYLSKNKKGNLDQMLYPYYKKDIDSGVMTVEEAQELSDTARGQGGFGSTGN